ncbi:MAG TPA: PASTA domain-containing protein, partial [Brevibacillus sp.]|nr:PASTA domain-containing protein [Brevibacillus sp.]
HMKVPPRKDGISKEINKALGERAPIEVPDMVGQTMKDIATLYETLPLVVSGKGKYVISQSPAPGVKIEDGGKIRIYLGDK